MIADAMLHQALVESQELGFLGARSVSDVIEHARGFVRALRGVGGRVIDLGSGGGTPGLIIAHDRPDLNVVLIDRRRTRTDFLERMVHRLGYTAQVTVVAGDVNRLVAFEPHVFDAVVARGFGPPGVTVRIASSLARQGGRIVISEPPSGDRWDPAYVRQLGLVREPSETLVAVFRRDTRNPAER